MNAHDIMKQFSDLSIYELKTIDNVRYIKIWGYFYDADPDEDERKNWRIVEFCGLEMPLTEYLAGSDDDRYIWECEWKQYIGDLTPEEALESFRSYQAVPLCLSEISDDTPDGFYY